MNEQKLITAAHAPRCCSECGEMARLFIGGRSVAEALAIAWVKKMGTREVLQQRITDMQASGLLLPYQQGD